MRWRTVTLAAGPNQAKAQTLNIIPKGKEGAILYMTHRGYADLVRLKINGVTIVELPGDYDFTEAPPVPINMRVKDTDKIEIEITNSASYEVDHAIALGYQIMP